MATAKGYERIVRSARSRQLRSQEEAIRRVEKAYRSAVRNLVERAEASDDLSDEHMLLSLLARMQSTLDAFEMEYAELLHAGALQMAQAAADRERAARLYVNLDDMEGLKPTMSFAFGQGQGSIQFGVVAQRAVEATAKRVFADGYALGDRLERLTVSLKQTISDTIVQGVAEQWSARELAKRLRSSLIDAGANNPHYQAMRIARTEINLAHREAHIASVTNEDGSLADFAVGIRWSLSQSHSTPDICDIYAAHDEGLGEGVYLPDDVPVSHPHCLCATVTVLKEYPEVSLPKMRPDTASVPMSEVRYAAENGDRTAARWLEKNGDE